MDDKNLITLSNGIVLKMKPVPPLLLNSIANSVPEPEVPKVWIEEKGREEENPEHPAYLKAIIDRANLVGIMIIDATLAVGTELVSVPDNMLKPEDDGWLWQAKHSGKEFDLTDPKDRYLAWLRYYAVETQDDLNNLNTIPQILAGIREGEVDKVSNSFRGDEERGADSELPPKNNGKNGHNIPANTARTRARN